MESWKKNLYVIWIAQVLSLSGFGFVLPFLPYFIQEVGVTDPAELNRWVGLINSIASIGMGLMAPVWGVLADKYSRKSMIARSMFAGAVLLFAMSYARTVGGIFILRLLQGLFCGTVTATTTLVSAGTPRERLSFALGFLSSSMFLGFSLGPLLGGLAAEYLGYRMAFKIGSILLVVGFIFVLVFVRELRHDEPKAADASKHAAPAKMNLRAVVLILGLFFALRFTRMLMPPFVPLHVQNLIGNVEGTAAAMGIISGLAGFAAAVAGVTLARLGDKINKVLLIAACICGFMLFTLPIFFTGGLYSFAVFYVLGAFAGGAVEPSLQSLFSEMTPASRRGKMFGIQTLVASLGWFFAPITSSFISNRLSIRHIFLFTVVFLGIALIYTLLANRGITRATRPMGVTKKNEGD